MSFVQYPHESMCVCDKRSIFRTYPELHNSIIKRLMSQLVKIIKIPGAEVTVCLWGSETDTEGPDKKTHP